MREKKPPVPAEKQETARQQIMSVLKGRPLSARDISAEVRISEKEVYGHLEHIQRSIDRGRCRLAVTPAECKKCGFVFKKRDRLRKPGKCPVCRSESITKPLFSIECR